MATTLQLHVAPSNGQPFEHELDGDTLVVGRASSADLVVVDPFLSRFHMRLYRQDGELLIEDLGSRNGTFVNGQRVEEPMAVGPGDVINISSSVISLRPVRGEGDVEDRSEDSLYRPFSTLVESQSSTDTANLREADDLRRYAERCKVLNEIHQALAHPISRSDLIELILDRVFDHFRPEESVVFLRRDGKIQRAATRSVPGLDSDFLYSHTLMREVTERGMAALVLDAQTDQRFADAHSMLQSGVRSLVAAPLLDPETEEVFGMLLASSRAQVRLFEEEDLEFLASLAAVAALRLRNVALAEEAAERRRIEEQLALARRIQLALLPSRIPEIPGYDLYGSNAPSQTVSGDYYQIVERRLADGARECVLMVADVSGKGIAASLLTTALEAMCAVPIQDGLPPDEICARISALLEARTPSEQFATAFLAALDPATGRVAYASAGHNPALLVRRTGAVEQLGCTGMPIALLPDSAYERRKVELDPGDLLVIYTDGLTEAFNADDEQFGIERLEAVCHEHRTASLPELAVAIESEIETFVAGEPYHDDRTLVIARRRED